MRPDEIRATGRLGGRAAAGVITQVEHVHRTVARRALATSGTTAAPVSALYDNVTRTAYGGVRTALLAAGAAAGSLGAVATRGGAEMGEHGIGNHAQSILNAVIGEHLTRDHDPLSIEMAIRHDGHDVDLTSRALCDAFPERSHRLAVFVHGLGENEHSWMRHASAHDGTYGSRLESELGYTPIWLRYNTGRHISQNGDELARLLTDLLRVWPGQIDELLLIGHSMGGLVIRAACHYGADDPWVPAVADIVYLGSPHAGAPAARGARMLAWWFDKLPETRPLGLMLDHSPGIRDLRYGYIVDDDWVGWDEGTCRQDHGTDVPLISSANHFVVSGAVTGGPAHPVARVVGDLLVPPSSANGRRRTRPSLEFHTEHSHHHEPLHHFDLLNHPAVYDSIVQCLDRTRQGR